MLEPSAGGGGNLWLCSEERFTRLHITPEEIKPSWIDKSSVEGDSNQYDVFISYAGEDREIAEYLTKALMQLEMKVFFAPFETAELWGRDNYVYFAEHAQKQSKYFIPLISTSYARKAWTDLELKSAFAKAINQSERYILPIRIDDTEVPGLLLTIGYVSLKEKSIEEIAQYVKQIVQES